MRYSCPPLTGAVLQCEAPAHNLLSFDWITQTADLFLLYFKLNCKLHSSFCCSCSFVADIVSYFFVVPHKVIPVIIL